MYLLAPPSWFNSWQSGPFSKAFLCCGTRGIIKLYPSSEGPNDDEPKLIVLICLLLA